MGVRKMVQQIEFWVGDRFVGEQLAPDVIEVGPRRLTPRPLAALSAIVVAVAALVLVHAGHSTRALALLPRIGRAGPASDAGQLGPPIARFATAPIDVVAAPDRLYVARVGGLTVLNASNGRVLADATVAELATHDDSMWYRLVLEPESQRLWLVDTDARHSTSRAIEFDASSLQRFATITIPSLVVAAVALDGQIFAATTDGVRVLGRVGSTPISGTSGFIAALAADPARHRLLLVIGDQLLAVRPDGRGRSVADLGLAEAQVSVADAAIWASGVDAATSRITRLDPATLRPLASVDPLSGAPGSVPQLVGDGARSIWVRVAGDASGLSCLDARTGALGQNFPTADGLLAVSASGSRSGAPARAYVVMGAAIRTLHLDGCPG